MAMIRTRFLILKSLPRQLSTSTKFQDQSRLRLQILASALNHVPKTGWTQEALALGAVEAGFSPATQGIFERGPIELVEYFMEECAYETSRIIEERSSELIDNKSNEERMVAVIELRLDQLKPYIDHWPQAMTLGLHPENSTTTVRNLALLADEMCHTIGLSNTDINWYVDRTIVGGVYAAAEIFMLTDKSENFQDTSEFVKRRVYEAYKLSSPQSNASVDERMKALVSCLPHMSKPLMKGMEGMIKKAGENAKDTMKNGSKAQQADIASVVSSSASMLLSTLSSILPAGYPPQRDNHSNPRHSGASSHGKAGGSSSSSGAYQPPKEEEMATQEEIEQFDQKNEDFKK